MGEEYIKINLCGNIDGDIPVAFIEDKTVEQLRRLQRDLNNVISLFIQSKRTDNQCQVSR